MRGGGTRADAQGSFIHLFRTRAVFMQALLHDLQENAQRRVERGAVALQKVAQPLRDRQHPLAHGQAGEHMVSQVRRCLGHAPGVLGMARVVELGFGRRLGCSRRVGARVLVRMPGSG